MRTYGDAGHDRLTEEEELDILYGPSVLPPLPPQSRREIIMDVVTGIGDFCMLWLMVCTPLIFCGGVAIICIMIERALS